MHHHQRRFITISNIRGLSERLSVKSAETKGGINIVSQRLEEAFEKVVEGLNRVEAQLASQDTKIDTGFQTLHRKVERITMWIVTMMVGTVIKLFYYDNVVKEESKVTTREIVRLAMYEERAMMAKDEAVNSECEFPAHV